MEIIHLEELKRRFRDFDTMIYELREELRGQINRDAEPFPVAACMREERAVLWERANTKYYERSGMIEEALILLRKSFPEFYQRDTVGQTFFDFK